MNKRKSEIDDLSEEFSKRLKLSDPLETLELCIAEMDLRIRQLEAKLTKIKMDQQDIYWNTVVS